jgi:hypothetical protein
LATQNNAELTIEYILSNEDKATARKKANFVPAVKALKKLIAMGFSGSQAEEA